MHFALANPCEKTICENLLQNLVKGVFIAIPTSAQGPPQNPPPQPGHPALLHNVHTLRHHYP